MSFFRFSSFSSEKYTRVGKKKPHTNTQHIKRKLLSYNHDTGIEKRKKSKTSNYKKQKKKK